MRSHELTTGRTFAVTFAPGEDFFETLDAFCRENEIRQGYIPMFIAAFRDVQIVGTCEKPTDPEAPVWSHVHLENVEAFGGGTLAYDAASGRVLPHIHVSVGVKADAANGRTSHLLSAKVQFLVEMVVVEILAPTMTRVPDPGMYNVPLLTFLPSE
ncbi:PPC domain-containing DNA-binding protein [Planomonospora parontospora]|uniref:PPC domain-containing DNA-binding protein n=1 Tax=Planomonospora parontospora TaxID=58119 RepID=UPI0016705524|nr:DUF296 domain-containing protein [Planomonospora parontospora]GGL42326.1 hypothetical protein GCM10014719_49540 [Planomonospora parontospora subsp. antibiotica]GII18407.1 hypothetical protein Ppa05_51330 [Planomonospora parontospora subsp. antibiotica]